MNYYVITPAKNEEKYIASTLDAMIHQTLKPLKWIIVDDGSTDRTIEIIEAYRKEHPWIEVVSMDTKQEKKLYGSKVIRAFNRGYQLIADTAYGFIVKLDADLSFPPNYFEAISTAFEKDKQLGICSGYVVYTEKEVAERMKRNTYVPGPIKSVRLSCFRQIGGFAEANGWDGLDQLHALYLGWKVENIPVTVIHLRPVTTEYRSLNFFYNNGIAHYRVGNDLFLSLLRAIIQLKQKPYFLAGFNYLRGYLKALFSGEPKLVDKELARFIRNHHYKKLLKLNRK